MPSHQALLRAVGRGASSRGLEQEAAQISCSPTWLSNSFMKSLSVFAGLKGADGIWFTVINLACHPKFTGWQMSSSVRWAEWLPDIISSERVTAIKPFTVQHGLG